MDGIDAPEKGMPYWKKSKQYLSTLIFGKQIYLKKKSTDRYGRWVARAYTLSKIDVSAQMIKMGYAWHFKTYNQENTLNEYEAQARQHHLGLWKDPKPYPPAYIRKLHRQGISTKKIFEKSIK